MKRIGTNKHEGQGFALSWVILVLAVVSLIVVPSAIQPQGHDPEQHGGPMPAHVKRLSPSKYLAPYDTDTKAICRGGVDGNSLDEVSVIAPLHKKLVACTTEQTWNVPGPPEPSYSSSIIKGWTSPIFWILGGGWTLLMWMIFVFPWVQQERQTKRAINKAEEKRRKDAESLRERQMLSVTSLWVHEEITDEQFDRKFSDLT